MKRAVFLDRDGVINRAFVRGGTTSPPANLDETEILPGVHEALADLHKNGFFLVVVTNQPDVARRKTTKDDVEQINNYLAKNLPLDEFRICYHDNSDACECRKPKAGLILRSAESNGIDLGRSFMIGDRWSDIEAGHRAGCTTILIENRNEERHPIVPDFYASDLLAATKIILGGSR